MTVLAKYQRLEAEAIWRPDPDAQRRDVIVSIGDATLTIAAPNGAVLSHWSLPAILRLNPGKTPALYSPGEDTPETLEVADEEMAGAIEAVLRAIQRGHANPGRVRTLGIAAVILILISAAVGWLPGAITRYAASLVPPGARAEIGNRMRDDIRRVAGPSCADAAGLRALAKLEERLFPETGTRLIVLPSALAETAHLPDDTILIGRGLVEDYETPEVLAGYLLAEDLRRRDRDPLERLLSDAGMIAALRLLTTGTLDDAALRQHAERLITAPAGPVADSRLIEAMVNASVSGAPYAYALDISGEKTKALIDASQDTGSHAPLLGDGDWLALQRICES